MSIYFTADTHFSHKKIINFENRPFSDVEEMNEQMIFNWNSRVKPTDEVYMLGDMFFGRGKAANILFNRLNGKKYLIKGNHDTFLYDKSFDLSLFEWVKDYYVLKDKDFTLILFHYPILSWFKRAYNSIHLYGHVHTHSSSLEQLGRAYNVGVDVNNFSPVSLEEVLSGSLQK